MERDCPHRGTARAGRVRIEVECCRRRQRLPSHLLIQTGDAGRVQSRAPAFPSPAPASCLPFRKAGALLQLDRNRQAQRAAGGRRDLQP